MTSYHMVQYSIMFAYFFLHMINVHASNTFEFQMTDLKMEAPGVLDHLQALWKEETSCTLVTSLGERMEVKLIQLLMENLLSPIFPGAILLAGCHQSILGISSLPGRFPSSSSSSSFLAEGSPPAVCSLFDLI